MKIKAVELMRKIRSKINSDIEGLSWEKESEYIKQHGKTFDFIVEKAPNKLLKKRTDQPAASFKECA